MTLFRVIAPVLVMAGSTLTAEPTCSLRGRVIDAGTGEPLAKALVEVHPDGVAATTGSDGSFGFEGLPCADLELTVTTVGYGLSREALRLEEGVRVVEIRLPQQALRTEERLTVTAPTEPAADPAAPQQRLLAGVELKSLASVLIDDPLRSSQALPGVTANDDFSATFGARGLGFSAVGLTIDGVLVSAPFHTVRDQNDSFSLTILNGDSIESLGYVAGAPPARHGERIGPALAAWTRDGRSDRFGGRAGIGVTGAIATLEGPLGKGRRTSWLVSARKSYLDYLIDRVEDEPQLVLGFYDVTAKLAHRAGDRHSLALLLLHGRSRWRSTETAPAPGDMVRADAGTDLARLEWRSLVSSHAWLAVSAFASRETGLNRNEDGGVRAESAQDQLGSRLETSLVAGSHHIEGGAQGRAVSGRGTQLSRDSRTGAYLVEEDFDASSAVWSAWAQDTLRRAGGRLSLSLGIRADRFDETGAIVVLPRLSLTFEASANARLFAASGGYAQFASFEQLLGEHGEPMLDAERSRHLVAGWEQRLGAATRLRVEAYAQRESDLVYDRDSEWRLVSGRLVAPATESRYENALVGTSRGLELTLHRRSVNGLSGWIGYAWARARRTDSGTGALFFSDFDQRHAVSVYASYRVTSKLHLSSSFRYGSGYPFPGFFEARPDGVYVAAERNLFRPGPYSRWDLRAARAFPFGHWKITAYAEVLNVLDEDNRRYTDVRSVNRRTGKVSLDGDDLLPRLFTAGISAEF